MRRFGGLDRLSPCSAAPWDIASDPPLRESLKMLACMAYFIAEDLADRLGVTRRAGSIVQLHCTLQTTGSDREDRGKMTAQRG